MITTTRGASRTAVPVTAALIGTLALQNTVPPFATDMYTPAFPEVTAALGTQASVVGLSLTAFFIGLGAGQIVGGPLSDRLGRRLPLIVGGLLLTVGAIGSALAPTIGVLIATRLLQGFGGGVAAAVGRAVIIDVVDGDRLARLLSIIMAISGLGPMVAPVAGAAVLGFGTWRTIFWALALFGLLMTLASAVFVPETLARERRHSGGLTQTARGFATVLRDRAFVGYTMASAFSGFAMIAYIANASYVLRGGKGMEAMPYALFFASTALAQILLTVLNARLIGRLAPRRLIMVGLASSSVAVLALVLGVGLWGTPLVLTAAAFLVLMASQAFIFGNAAALGATNVASAAGAAAGVQGLTQAAALALGAPIASSGGSTDAWPMVAVMVVGVVGAWLSVVMVAGRSTLRRPVDARSTVTRTLEESLA